MKDSNKKNKTKIFFDNSVTWIAIVVGLASVIVAENVIIQESKLESPLTNFEQREKKLTFGLFVTPNPDQNPINPPERFTGYHTGLDIEILPQEATKDVPVLAACEGKILTVQQASGYGGVVVQSCNLEGEKVTVLYGHLDYRSFKVKKGNRVQTGQQIAILGDHKTDETGFTRKHLHFGIHKGNTVVLAGYTQNKSGLSDYLDPFPLLTPQAIQ